ERRYSLDYTGIELDRLFYEAAIERHAGRPNFHMRHGSAADGQSWQGLEQPDAVVALETCEHIPERDSFRIIERIAALEPRVFVCSVPVEVGPATWVKNVGSAMMGYGRHKSY